MVDKTNKDNSPLFGSWRNFYLVVILWLVLIIVLLYSFTQMFR